VGEFTLNGGELQKGSVLNVADTAILAGGVMNGTLSGLGTVYVTGDVQLGDAAKLTTSGLNITGTLNVGSKGLTMNAKSSAISIAGGTLASEGKLSAASLTMVGGALDVSNAKPMTVTLTGVANLSAGATVDLYGAFTAADLDMNDATFMLGMDDGYVNQPKPQNITLKDKNATSELTNGSTLDVMGSMSVAGGLKLSDSTLSLHDWGEATKPRAQTLTVKGALEVNDSELSLNGKLTAGSLNLTDADIKLENTTAAQSIALTLAKDTQKQVVVNTLTESTIDATGSMTVAGALELTDSSISLHDVDSAAKPKAMGLTVKDALTIADISSIGNQPSIALLNLQLTLGGGVAEVVRVEDMLFSSNYYPLPISRSEDASLHLASLKVDGILLALINIWRGKHNIHVLARGADNLSQRVTIDHLSLAIYLIS
jgi:hypothetical protein